MAKLTLSVDDRVISAARRYAKQHGLSVSEMVEAYLAVIGSRASSTEKDAPILRSLRGSLKKGDVGESEKHLAAKYR